MSRGHRLHLGRIIVNELDVANRLARTPLRLAEHGPREIESGESHVGVVVREISPGAHTELERRSAHVSKESRAPKPVVSFPRVVEQVVEPCRDVVLRLKESVLRWLYHGYSQV